MPREADKDQITFFARTNFRNREVPFGIKADDRRRHMYVIGKTGMGKTTMMENMAIQDIRNGHGMCFIDPHGDSVAKILNFVPNNRINDVIYFNPADLEHPIAFNILEAVESKYKHLVASGLMGVFTKIWANLWSARMEYILNNTVLALLDSPGNTMLGIARMYVDKKYRKKIVDNIKDPMVKAFWVDEFANYNEKYRTEAIAPIQNKVGQFLSSAVIRNIVGQPRSTIDLRSIMDTNKILLMDLSKGKVGEDNAALLGAMIITKLQLAALSRVDIPENERADFYLYVDEFQNFATESFATILSEARKYHLNLTVGHQYIGQLIQQDKSTKIRDAVFGNVGSMVCFRVGAADAEFLETEFAPQFAPVNLVNLPKYNVILKLMINGITSEPFTAITMPVNPDFYTGNSEKVIKVSRERFANPVAQVEERISRWMGAEFHEASAVMIGGKEGGVETQEQQAESQATEEAPQPRALNVPITPEVEAPPTLEPQEPSERVIENLAPQQEDVQNLEISQSETASETSPDVEVEQKMEAQKDSEPESTGKEPPRQAASLVHEFKEDVRPPMPEGRREQRFDRSRSNRPQNQFGGAARGKPFRDKRGGKKPPAKKQSPRKDNPIWDTVSKLHEERVERIFSQKGDEQQSQKKPDADTSPTRIVRPGESVKF